ncbi:2-hydroxymuconate tautomerase [mine drainage metagenome]|uniref:2-hydroxymuconate tautomerase n=1 Tax=mine drainage metagenome TaxID=410659 RepID=A0A1J5QGG5_9ZZZZ
MPTIRIEMFEGRSDELKQELVRQVTDAVVATLQCSPDSVDIILQEVPKSHWATGGRLWSQR